MGLQPPVMSSLLAMNVPSQFVGVVMNMSGRMVPSLVLSARLDTKDTKVLAPFKNPFLFHSFGQLYVG